MQYLFLVLCFLAILIFIAKILEPKSRYDSRGFDHNHIHRNGTKFDDHGYDYWGYDKSGYNRQGYNKKGRNRKGQYDRFFDTTACDEEGFLDPYEYPIGLPNHARERLAERLGINDPDKMELQAIAAYRYGRSKRQIKKTSAYLIEEIEQRHSNGVVLIYKNYIYLFSYDNELITVFKNDKIPL